MILLELNIDFYLHPQSGSYIIKHNAVKITFKDYKHATKFRLIYEKTPEIF